MYILDTLYYLYKRVKRADLISISKEISEQKNISKTRVIADMVWCAVKYGTMWTEYGDLRFYNRSAKNRASFITTFYNFKLYDRLNAKSERNTFHDKIEFLEKFSSFTKRAWVSTEKRSDEDILEFLRKHHNVVAKASYGDSGKEVEVINIAEDDDLNDVVKHIREQNFNLIEEQIFNHPLVKELNASSLNTLRIVTVRGENKVDVLFTGIRVGGKGAKIDNISQGGRVARIDVSTGKINSSFYAKSSSHGLYASDKKDINATGYQIPFWDKVIDTVKRAATVVPQIRIVAWDVAITADGIELVEGNESFGSVIMQLYYNHNECGVKPQLMKILEDE